MATWDDMGRRTRRGADGGRRRIRLGSLLDALFGEAWELQRRRRRRYVRAWLIVLAAAALVGGLLLGRPARNGPTPRGVESPAVTHGDVTSLVLPRSGAYGSLAVVGGQMLVWGSSEGSIDSAPLGGPGTCDVSVIDPRTLALEDTRHGNCANPRLFDERVLLDETVTRGGDTGLIEDVRVSVATGAGGYRVGPVLARYEQCSDCEDSYAYGDGSLWIYIPTPLEAPAGKGELLEISERTGAVDGRWRMPELIRALLAADVDGLWVAPSLYSGEPEHVPTSEQRDYESLYRVAPGMRAPRRTHLIGISGARWMLAARSTVWVDSGSPQRTTVTGLAGPAARTIFSAKAGVAECTALGTSAVAGDARAGLDCLGGGETGDSAVFRYSPGTGALLARTPMKLPVAAYQAPAAVDGSAFYFLDPPNFTYAGPGPTATAQGSGVLYRVRAR